jgi:acid phosphatase (class A)
VRVLFCTIEQVNNFNAEWSALMSCRHLQTLFSVAFAIVILASVPGFAEERSCPKTDSVPLAVLLMPPPDKKSAETKAELRELLTLQNQRTPDQAKHAEQDYKRTIDRFFGEIGIKVDDWPNSAQHFFECVAATAEDAVNEAKTTFRRTRPYKLPHNGLHILKTLKDDDTFSYPSGHATYGTVTGLLLAEMLPEKREKILKRIEDYGYSRMVSGVHFRSDVYAGQVAGATIVAFLLKDKTFRDRFEDAKTELRRALGY